MANMCKEVLKRIKKYISGIKLTMQDMDDLISEVIVCLLESCRSNKNINEAVKETIIKRTVLRFLGKMKKESLLREKLRKEVMKFLGFEEKDLIKDYKEENNGS